MSANPIEKKTWWARYNAIPARQRLYIGIGGFIFSVIGLYLNDYDFEEYKRKNNPQQPKDNSQQHSMKDSQREEFQKKTS